MSDILNEKVDLSALNLGSFTLSALLGAVVTFCICVIAMRLILSLLRRMLDKTRLDATLRKYALGAVRLELRECQADLLDRAEPVGRLHEVAQLEGLRHEDDEPARDVAEHRLHRERHGQRNH